MRTNSMWSEITPYSASIEQGPQRRVNSGWSEITPDDDGYNNHMPLQPPIGPTTDRAPRIISSGWSEITPEPAVYRGPAAILAAIRAKKLVDSGWSHITSEPTSIVGGPNAMGHGRVSIPMPPTAPVANRPRVSSGWSEITPESAVVSDDKAHGQQAIALTELEAGGQSPPTAGRALVIPLADAVPTICERCREEVESGYVNRRAHVYAKHRPKESEITLETQEALKRVMEECFPSSTVRNDLMCNHAGCGKGVTIYKNHTAIALQRFHIQQHHLGLIDEEISPLACPVRGCIKWSGKQRDERTMRAHIQYAHKSMSEVDRIAYDQLFERVKRVAGKHLSAFFPHTPKGYLSLGTNNNSSHGVKKTVRVDILQLRSSANTERIEKPVSEGEPEQSETNCRECSEMVRSSYLKRREHVVGTHMESGEMEDGTVAEQQDPLKMEISRCFPTATVLNDLMCNYSGCGMQVQHMAERTVSELQSYHIQEHHLNSMGEEAHITCPIASCSKMRHSIPHMLALNYHLRNSHDGVGGLTSVEKEVYSQTKDRVRKATKELLPQCFPHTPSGYLNSTSSQYRKRKTQLDEEIDESIFLNRY